MQAITCTSCGNERGNDIDGTFGADWPCCVTASAAPPLIVSELQPMRSLCNIHFSAAEIVSSLDTAVEDWEEGRYDHEAHHEAMANIWKVAEAAGVADAAKRIICTR